MQLDLSKLSPEMWISITEAYTGRSQEKSPQNMLPRKPNMTFQSCVRKFGWNECNSLQELFCRYRAIENLECCRWKCNCSQTLIRVSCSTAYWAAPKTDSCTLTGTQIISQLALKTAFLSNVAILLHPLTAWSVNLEFCFPDGRSGRVYNGWICPRAHGQV